MVRPKSTDTPAKEKILRTAADLFFRQGYYQTGTNQIIAEAGVSKATFYANFPAKEDLAVAYVKQSAAASMKAIHGRMSGSSDPYERCLMFMGAMQEFIMSTDYRGCNFTNIAREFPNKTARVRQEVVAFENEYRAALRDSVADLFEANPDHFQSAGLSVDEVTDRYYLLLEGAITAAANFNDPWPLRAAAKAIRELIGMPEDTVVHR